ncbi:Gfo/Idh/MocA family protein [Pleomorphovibrio marinus]|uniref:Gfo/Idh/MocA family protein n=1 Tax=Pleomorphovibrio marinus TaxID=2164132 RepID=UPI000E0AFCA5|nr:Gfo/Idh/MocA family oxidoreductase [Pleomorphovibrio marinus]
MEISRRTFIKKSTQGGLAFSLASGLYLPRTVWGANEKVNVGLIGCRNKGFNVLKDFLNTASVNCTGICDVDSKLLEERTAELNSDFSQSPKTYSDFRKMLEDKDMDAVIVGSPDHWHCLHTVNACQAGKDVYVEKPLANSIAECRVMTQSAQKHKRVVQVGQQQRSGVVWNGVMDYIKDGKLGKLRQVNIWANFNYGIGAKKEDDRSVPQGVDYDFWLGPAPKRSFNPTRFHGNWRHFWDYGGGLMTDWGVHLIDMALWAKDITTPPKKVMAYGENLSFEDHSRETFDTMSVVFPMEDYVINWQHTAGIQSGPYDMLYGVEFVGDKSTIVANRENWILKLEGSTDKEEAEREASPYRKTSPHNDMGNHVRDFLAAIKSRKETKCPISIGENVAMYAHMGNIAARTGSGLLEWDSERQAFQGNKEANDLLMPEYRKPWEFPKA